MIVTGVEGASFDEAAREVYVIDNYLAGRVLVFDMDTYKFKRGWGAYGKPLSDIGPMPRPAYDPKVPLTTYKDFQGHVTLMRRRKRRLRRRSGRPIASRCSPSRASSCASSRWRPKRAATARPWASR